MLPLWRNWKGLIPWVLAALGETAVTIPWLMTLYSIQGDARWPDALPGTWLLLLAYLSASLWEAGAPRAEKGAEASARSRVVALVTGVATVYGLAYAVQPAVFRTSIFRPGMATAVIPVALYLWYQGVRSVAQGLEYSRAFIHFLWQGLFLVVGIVALLLTGGARDVRVSALLYWSVPLLFASGLGLLVVTRDRELRAGQVRSGDAAGGSDLSGTLIALVVGLVAVTMVASEVLSVERLTAWGHAASAVVDPAFEWLVDVLMLIVYRWILPIAAFLTWLTTLIKNHSKPFEPPPVESGKPDPFEQYRNRPTADWSYLVPYFKVALLIGLVVLVAWLLVRRFRLEREDTPDAEEERISLGFWKNLMADQRALLGMLRRKAGAALMEAGDLLDPQNPRVLFQRLQLYGLRAGRPRKPGETPNTYRDQLSVVRPEAASAAKTVTMVYNQARYSANAPDASAVDEAAAALAALPDADLEGDAPGKALTDGAQKRRLRGKKFG